ncbi:MAG TPA: M20/M25/M40 family metallo-hydrolase [Gemmatimonadaceae bacterium]|jgi:acetylornithine deacetylase/succinyl-diaminopimelate desuccinylase-like protein|nr:M20/M25/M40 family metallo-hydrolase [Gemmatimonadaceae bacterium]
MPLIRSSQRSALLVASILGAAPLAAQAPSIDPTAALLQELIRANTSNPPGNERRVAEALLPHFRALGIDAKIIPTPDSTKGVFIARLKGDGSKRPVLIAAHEDVVGVEREKWSVDPFAGVEKDGHIYGRGAVDFKGGMAVFARAVMMLAEQKIPLARDVIFLAEADEEGGGGYSTSWLAREHWDEIDAEFALNEGGWIMKAPDGHVRYVSISTADKLSLPLKITARGTSTHASMPRPDNAIFGLSRAMAKISNYETPIAITPEQRQFFLTLAKTSKPPMSTYYRDLVGEDAAKANAADKIISKDPLMHSLMRNTLAPTIINGGFRLNVIPGSVEATINLRMIPGSDPAQLVATLKKVVADTGIQFALNAPTYARNAPSPTSTDLYRALEKSAKAVFPGVEVTPYLFQAGTDAGAWRSKGVPVYGIYPYPIDDDELSRMHGNDEKVSIASLKQGTEMIYRTLVEVAGKK